MAEDELFKAVMQSAIFVPMPALVEKPPTSIEDRLKFLIGHHEQHRRQVHDNIRREYHLKLSARSRPSSNSNTRANTDAARSEALSLHEKRLAQVAADLNAPFEGDADDDPCVNGPNAQARKINVAVKTVQPVDDETLREFIKTYDERTMATKQGWEKWLRNKQIENGTLPKDVALGSSDDTAAAKEAIHSSNTQPTTSAGATNKDVSARKASEQAKASETIKKPQDLSKAAPQQRTAPPLIASSASIDPRKRKNPFGDCDARTLQSPVSPGDRHAEEAFKPPPFKRASTAANMQQAAASTAQPIWAQRRKPSLAVDTAQQPNKDAGSDTAMSDAPPSASSLGPVSAPATPGASRDTIKPARRPAWEQGNPPTAPNQGQAESRRASASALPAMKDKPQRRSHSPLKRSTSSGHSLPKKPPDVFAEPLQERSNGDVRAAPVTQTTTSAAPAAPMQSITPTATNVDASRDPRRKKPVAEAPPRHQPPAPQRQASDIYGRRW